MKFLHPLLFLVAAGCVAALLTRLLPQTEWAVFGFAAIAIIASCVIASQAKWIDKTAADSVYYVIGAVGVALIFAYEAPKRQKLNFLLEYRGLETQKNMAEAEQRRTERDLGIADAIARQPEMLLTAVKREAVHASFSLPGDFDMGRACAEADGILLERPLDRDRTDRFESEHRRWQARETCNAMLAHRQRVQEERAKRISAVHGIDELGPLLRELGTQRLEFHGSSLSFAELEKLLPSERPTVRLADQLKQLGLEIDKMSTNLEARRKEFDGFQAELAAATTMGRLVELYWPFLLISLLGLKLARSP